MQKQIENGRRRTKHDTIHHYLLHDMDITYLRIYNYIMTSNITKKVIEDLIASDKKGLEEYGVTVDREDYTLRDWLQEAYEETCDTAKYLKAAIEKIDKQNIKNE
jgi:hypothetical protein